VSELNEVAVVPMPEAEFTKLSDYVISQIHNGLLRPSDASLASMAREFGISNLAREIRKLRGTANPDLV
jgi:hypothetical protein